MKPRHIIYQKKHKELCLLAIPVFLIHLSARKRYGDLFGKNSLKNTLFFPNRGKTPSIGYFHHSSLKIFCFHLDSGSSSILEKCFCDRPSHYITHDAQRIELLRHTSMVNVGCSQKKLSHFFYENSLKICFIFLKPAPYNQNMLPISFFFKHKKLILQYN